tara:strand:+ start:139 stop:1245 length:1107 start_codon:yes stop_codon:yes gene_type:complete
MSKRDFIFLGHDTSTNSSNGIRYKMYLTGKANGLDSTQNGGYATVGSAGLHASLSNSLSNSGTYYRAYNFLDDATGNDTEEQWSGLAYLATSSMGAFLNHASGTLYSAPNRTNGKQPRAAISQRAHLRIETSTGNSTGANVGSAIGMFFGSSTPTQGNKFQVPQGHFLRNDNGAVTGSSCSYIANDIGLRIPGYQVALTSLLHESNHTDEENENTNFGNEGVRLVFMATPQFNYGEYDHPDGSGFDKQTVRQLRECAGTYAFNRWYRVRWDITMLQGTHIIEVYTATPSDTIGSETWTKVLTEYVYGAQNCFAHTYGANAARFDNYKGMGYFVYARSQAAASAQGRHSVYIDNYQVLSETLETSQPNN